MPKTLYFSPLTFFTFVFNKIGDYERYIQDIQKHIDETADINIPNGLKLKFVYFCRLIY